MYTAYRTAVLQQTVLYIAPLPDFCFAKTLLLKTTVKQDIKRIYVYYFQLKVTVNVSNLFFKQLKSKKVVARSSKTNESEKELIETIFNYKQPSTTRT